MGRFKTKEERIKKKMESNPMSSSALSNLEVPKEEKELTPDEKVLVQKGATEERQRVLSSIFTNKEALTAEYKILINHVGGLTAGSMCVAYSRAVNDVIKLILKENK